MLPSWVDPHISLDGIAAILVFAFGGGTALWRVFLRFDRVEIQSKANATTLKDHGVKIDQFGEVLIRMERSDGRVNMLEQVQVLQGRRIDELISIAINGTAPKALTTSKET